MYGHALTDWTSDIMLVRGARGEPPRSCLSGEQNLRSSPRGVRDRRIARLILGEAGRAKESRLQGTRARRRRRALRTVWADTHTRRFIQSRYV